MSPSAGINIDVESATKPRLRWSWDFGPLLQDDVDTTRLLHLLTAVAEGPMPRSANRGEAMPECLIAPRGVCCAGVSKPWAPLWWSWSAVAARA
jgi:hypothetical protein